MRVFVTGIVGTLGTALATLHHDNGDAVMGCSRNEERALAWHRDHRGITNHVSNAGSKEMLRLMDGCDRIYHCAALKHVDVAEENPLEAWRQNVVLTADVANERTVFISSDKACAAGGMGVYGATKLTAERIAMQAGAAVVRLGNLVGSSGSVLSLWRDAAAKGEPIRVTDRSMTRFFLDVLDAAEFASREAVLGRVVVPKQMRAAVMGDVADVIARRHQTGVIEVGRRPGETQHQWIVAPGDGYLVDGNRLVLSGGADDLPGVCSSSAPRWDLDDLLALAGVRP